MSDNSEPKKQTYRIRFENDGTTEITFGTEPDGMYIEFPPKTQFDVVFSQSEETELTVSFKDHTFDDKPTLTLSIMSQAHIYRNNELIHPIWKNVKEDKD